MSEENIISWLKNLEQNYNFYEKRMEFNDCIQATMEDKIAPQAVVGYRELREYKMVVMVRTTGERETAAGQLRRHLYADLDIELGQLISSIEAGADARETIRKINTIRNELR